MPVETAAEKAPSAETDEESENSDSVTTLSVPGFGARDISVTLHKPEDFLVVEGASKALETLRRRSEVPRTSTQTPRRHRRTRSAAHQDGRSDRDRDPWMSSFRTWR